MQEVASAEWNASICIPLQIDMGNTVIIKQRYAHLLRLEEIFGIIQKHFLYAWIEYNTTHWPFVAGVCPAPRSMGFCKVYLDSMNSLSLVFFLGLKDQLFQYRIGPRDNTDRI
jgi:hypothetical protein